MLEAVVLHVAPPTVPAKSLTTFWDRGELVYKSIVSQLARRAFRLSVFREEVVLVSPSYQFQEASSRPGTALLSFSTETNIDPALPFSTQLLHARSSSCGVEFQVAYSGCKWADAILGFKDRKSVV